MFTRLFRAQFQLSGLYHPQRPRPNPGLNRAVAFQLSGLAFEVHDSYMNRKAAEKESADETTRLKVKYQSVSPTFLDMMLYSYCYVGLLTGETGRGGMGSAHR